MLIKDENKVKFYQQPNGKEPFVEWSYSLDKTNQFRIFQRLNRLARGNFGDCKAVGDGVYELRLFFGKGYRVYFGKEGNTIIIILCGGDKKTQSKDIEKAKQFWRDYNEQ